MDLLTIYGGNNEHKSRMKLSMIKDDNNEICKEKQ